MKHPASWKLGRSAYCVEREWTTSYGLACMVVRPNPCGHLCGYVRIPPNHPAYSCSYDELQVEVHGGLSFSCADADGEGWWLGFACAHYGDALYDPAAKQSGLHEYYFLHEYYCGNHLGHYWTLEEVIAEVEHLAAQLAAMMPLQVVAQPESWQETPLRRVRQV